MPDLVSSQALFQENVRVLREYTDSLRIVSDSAEFNRIINVMDERLTKINYNFKPETDLNLTEDENDSINRLIKIFLTEKKNVSLRLLKKELEDSIINEGL